MHSSNIFNLAYVQNPNNRIIYVKTKLNDMADSQNAGPAPGLGVPTIRTKFRFPESIPTGEKNKQEQ